MSQSHFIGLSEEQVQSLLAGNEVMKRPYWHDTKFNKNRKYQYDNYRIFIKMLSPEEKAKEPKTAFGDKADQERIKRSDNDKMLNKKSMK